MLLGYLLSLTMWIAGVCLFAFFHCVVVRGAETMNSMVTCTACQTLQAQIDNWSCDINCKVANGNNGIFDIVFYVSCITKISWDRSTSRDVLVVLKFCKILVRARFCGVCACYFFLLLHWGCLLHSQFLCVQVKNVKILGKQAHPDTYLSIDLHDDAFEFPDSSIEIFLFRRIGDIWHH